MVDLWAARLERSLTKEEAEALLCLLPSARRERLLRVRQEERRREPLCAYALLHMALRERYQWKELPEITTTALGKPFFPDYPEVHFSISHTSGAVLVGVSDQPVGVDIEKIRPMRASFMRRLFGTARETDFFTDWVRREARAKGSGSGISAILHVERPMQAGESYYPLDVFPGYAAGVAVLDGTEPGEIRKYWLV